MINCKECVKSDVCRYSVGLPDKLKNLSNCKEMQELNMFKFSFECGSYVQATKILGGNYEQ
jgi:hypothetical protein